MMTCRSELECFAVESNRIFKIGRPHTLVEVGLESDPRLLSDSMRMTSTRRSGQARIESD